MRIKILMYLFPLLIPIKMVFAVSLTETVDITLKTNPEVLTAVHERNAVSKEIDQARAGYLPSLDLALGTGYERTNNPTTRNFLGGEDSVGYNRNEASLNARQMLFDGLLTQNEVARQTARTNSRSHTVYSTAENTALMAIEAYLNVLRRQRIVEFAQDNLEAHLRTHDQISLRSERGVGRRADLDQSLGRLSLAETNLVAEQGNLLDAQTNYVRVVGIEPVNLTNPESPAELIPATVEDAIDTAINNHPTLKSAVADVESANFQHESAIAPFMPRIDFEVGVRQDNNIDGLRGSDRDLQAMFRLRYNLLNGGRDLARRQETAALINQAAEIRNNTYREVEQSTRLSWNALKTVISQMRYFEQYAQSAEKTRDAYRLQFSLGQRTLLDLLDSENELFRSRISLTESRYDELFAMYRLLNSTGLLLEGLNVQPPQTAATIDYN